MMGLMRATSWLRAGEPPRHRGARRLACAVTSVVVLAGCTSSTEQPDPASESSGDEAALQIELTAGAGDLDREARDELQGQVGDVLSTYVVAAFLGDYPRDDFVDSLEVFTSGAAAKAAGDIDLLTARRYGDADDVKAERLRARVSVFAADDVASGVSARVRFRFAVHDGGEEPATFGMAGRLSLVPEQGGWRIFAYDVSRQDPPTEGVAG